ncbi:hypothetical protein A6V36_14290 [Paraburkholderia ginsengiterrae]|uniref:Endolytic peptidoglycan transglycosylase RlpA n=1 Tax=Paraburkholderia ginsengiterrae TaxID=1462993 RepID=A0A1A9N7L3_9BURK|nr:septal ring lytic transglycosylase RlpA family protein [Paraburkholderia ginsengiterrae]OAJ52568.1 hypothetical protein A6V36_14290 [Paraburkholderia ginsengiterrae]OAJ59172.1 hypothetical protein A6V37_27930 [Paraburkholderia ginsengiterrae]
MNSYINSISGAKRRVSIVALFGLMLVLAGCAQQSVEPASLSDRGAVARTSRDTAAPSADDDSTSRPLDVSRGEPKPTPPADDGELSSMAACACGKSFEQTGRATWYGNLFHGRRTASGERYDMHAFTAAHRTLPLGACVRVTALGSARSVIVRINDRGPFVRGRIIDLSYAAAQSLGMVAAGNAQVKLERIAPQRQASAGRVCSERGT